MIRLLPDRPFLVLPYFRHLVPARVRHVARNLVAKNLDVNDSPEFVEIHATPDLDRPRHVKGVSICVLDDVERAKTKTILRAVATP